MEYFRALAGAPKKLNTKDFNDPLALLNMHLPGAYKSGSIQFK